MKLEKICQMMKSQSIHLPLILIKNYQNLKLEPKDLLLIGYLLGIETLNYQKIAADLNLNQEDVLIGINSLQEKGYLEIKIVKNLENVMEETFSLDNLFSKLALSCLEDKKDNETTVFKLFEEELGRTLSSMEYEIINSWLDSGFKEELIKEALKEAVFNGAKSLRYVDRILFEWNKKGIKTIKDLAKKQEKFHKSKKEEIIIPDYNWLEDNE